MIRNKKLTKICIFITILLVGFIIYITTFRTNVSGEKYKFDYRSKTGYVTYITDRSILYVKKGYMTKDEIKEFGKNVDRGINEIEEYLGMKFDRSHYTTDKVVYYLNGDGGGSQNAGGYSKNLNTGAVVYLYNAKKKICPYIHETTHIIAWDFGSLWVREGLAVYINDKLKGDPTVPNGGKNIDELSKKYIINNENKTALDLVGKNGIPNFGGNKERLDFYIFSSSLVKYLEENIGLEKLMKIYESDDTERCIKELTGESAMEWKQKWIDNLTK